MKLPALKAQEVIAALKKLGFHEKRQSGSHLILMNPKTGKIIPVPIHKGKDLKRGVVRSIIRQAGLDKEDFLKLLQ